MLRLLPSPTLFPYTTLFRSRSYAIRFAATSTTADQAATDTCFPNALKAGRPAEVIAERPTVEGDPIVSYFRVPRSEEHTSELQSHSDLVCRLLLEKKKKKLQHTLVSVVVKIHRQQLKKILDADPIINT